MQALLRFLFISSAAFLIGCAGLNRTAFTPTSGPTTVGMPAELNERERLFAPDIEGALRANGLLPVRHGAGDLSLEFTMSAGPINTDTRIALQEGDRIVAIGEGRASGVPLIGRSSVAQKSFNRAFETFQTQLNSARDRRGWDASAITNDTTADQSLLPIY